MAAAKIEQDQSTSTKSQNEYYNCTIITDKNQSDEYWLEQKDYTAINDTLNEYRKVEVNIQSNNRSV